MWNTLSNTLRTLDSFHRPCVGFAALLCSLFHQVCWRLWSDGENTAQRRHKWKSPHLRRQQPLSLCKHQGRRWCCCHAHFLLFFCGDMSGFCQSFQTHWRNMWVEMDFVGLPWFNKGSIKEIKTTLSLHTSLERLPPGCFSSLSPLAGEILINSPKATSWGALCRLFSLTAPFSSSSLWCH